MLPSGIEGAAAEMSFSWATFALLVLLLGLSVGVYARLVHRWTSHRLWIDVADWARTRGYKALAGSRAAGAAVPDVLTGLVAQGARVEALVSGRETTIASLHAAVSTFGRPAAGTTEAPPAATPASVPARWNVLVRRIEADWKPTGLRPTNADASVLDLYSLSSYPLMGDTLRFTVYGTDTLAARSLSKSHARALLPGDVGLLLHGPNLMLDFSTRPFDTIAFERMIALADQLATHLRQA